VVDGYGFHEGYFKWRRYANGQPAPPQLSLYGRRAFDQGLGRSLWFINGADVELIPRTIAAFDAARRADLWSGVGLACAYAGGVDKEAVEKLRRAAGPYASHAAQGCAFAAKARERARNPAAHTEMACLVLCDARAEAAARVTDVALGALPMHGPESAYECWRRRIRERFEPEVAAV